MGPLAATRVMANISDILTIPKIPLIIKISWKLCFQKGITLDICPDIINIYVIPNIPTIPEISIIIKISSSLWFQNGMTLDVCPDISKILNIPKILNIHDIPKIPTIPELTKLQLVVLKRYYT